MDVYEASVRKHLRYCVEAPRNCSPGDNAVALAQALKLPGLQCYRKGKRYTRTSGALSQLARRVKIWQAVQVQRERLRGLRHDLRVLLRGDGNAQPRLFFTCARCFWGRVEASQVAAVGLQMPSGIRQCTTMEAVGRQSRPLLRAHSPQQGAHACHLAAHSRGAGLHDGKAEIQPRTWSRPGLGKGSHRGRGRGAEPWTRWVLVSSVGRQPRREHLFETIDLIESLPTQQRPFAVSSRKLCGGFFRAEPSRNTWDNLHRSVIHRDLYIETRDFLNLT